jgi:hypothetical protein
MSEGLKNHTDSETLVLAEHLGIYAATQPCSGTTIVVSHAFSPGSGTASPQVIFSTKTAA